MHGIITCMWHQENKSHAFIFATVKFLTGTVLKVFNLVQNHTGTIPKQYNTIRKESSTKQKCLQMRWTETCNCSIKLTNLILKKKL